MRSTLTAMLIGALVIALFVPGVMAQEVMSVEGQVTLPDGDPLAGVNVTATNVTTGESYHSMTNESGAYNLTIPTGTYNITASYTNYSADTSYTGVLVNVSLSGIDFVMSELLGTLRGYVTNGTAPVPSATVHLMNEFFHYTGNSTTPLGEYEIVDIAPGVYIAYVEKRGYWTALHDRPVEIERDKVSLLDFTIEEQPAVLFGTVSFGGDGLEGVKITIVSSEFSTSTLTDSGGNYTLSGIPLGSYTITFSKEGFVDQTMRVSLSPFESKKLDLSMEKEVSDQGGFIPGFDLPHSLMVVGMILSIITLISAMIIKLRVQRNPELLMQEEEEES